MQVGVDVKCMHTDFGGRGPSSFGDIASLFAKLIMIFIVPRPLHLIMHTHTHSLSGFTEVLEEFNLNTCLISK